MTDALPTLQFRTRAQWRTWLAAHHRDSAGLWLVFLKGDDAKRGVSYEDAVREALCYGWIDSLVKRLDDQRYARKFTPRKPDSVWSDSNRTRWAELDAAGLLAPAGRAAAPTAKTPPPAPPIPVMADELAAALREHPAARRTFEALPPSQRRRYVAWIHLAKRPATREKRLRDALTLLEAGKALGLK